MKGFFKCFSFLFVLLVVLLSNISICSATSYYVSLNNVNGTSSPVPGNGALVTIESAPGPAGSFVCTSSDTNGKSRCINDIDGNVTHLLYNKNGPAGTEYWGSFVEYINSDDSLRNITYTRSMPYVSSILFKSSYSSTSYSSTNPVYTGTGTTTAKVQVVKPSSYPYGSYSNIFVYLYVKAPSDSSYTTYGPLNLTGSGTVFFNLPMTRPGVYYFKSSLKTRYGSWVSTSGVLTDSWAPTVGPTVQVFGSASITLGPQGFNDGRWAVDGGPWQVSGATVPSLSVGNHTVSFKSVAGWKAPSNATINIAGEVLVSKSYNYTRDSGSLKVTLSPPEAVSAGAKWTIDNGTLLKSGTELQPLPVGSYTVQYSDVSCWNTPSNKAVTINSSSMTSATGLYTAKTGSLTFNINNVAGGNQNLNGRWDVYLYDSNNVLMGSKSVTTPVATFNSLTAGNYSYYVFYNNLDGWGGNELWGNKTAGIACGESKTINFTRYMPWVSGVAKGQNQYSVGNSASAIFTITNGGVYQDVTIKAQLGSLPEVSKAFRANSTTQTDVTLNLGVLPTNGDYELKYKIEYARLYEPMKATWLTDHGNLTSFIQTQGTTKRSTHISVSSIDGSPGQPVALSAKLEDIFSASSPVAVSGKSLSFSAGGQTCNAVTDSVGFATCNITVDQPTIDNISVVYSGDNIYAPSSATGVLTLARVWEKNVTLVDGGPEYTIPIGFESFDEYGHTVWNEYSPEIFYVKSGGNINDVAPEDAAKLYAMSKGLNYLLTLSFDDIDNILSTNSYEATLLLGEISFEQQRDALLSAEASVLSGFASPANIGIGTAICGGSALFSLGTGCVVGAVVYVGLSAVDGIGSAVDEWKTSTSVINSNLLPLLIGQALMNEGFSRLDKVHSFVSSLNGADPIQYLDLLSNFNTGSEGLGIYRAALESFSEVGLSDGPIAIERISKAAYVGIWPGASAIKAIYTLSTTNDPLDNANIQAVVLDVINNEKSRMSSQHIFQENKQSEYVDLFSQLWATQKTTAPEITIQLSALAVQNTPGKYNFTANVTGLTVGEIQSYFFEFGDGSRVFNKVNRPYIALPVASKTYTQAGTFTAKVTLSTFDGRSRAATTAITVTQPSQQAGIPGEFVLNPVNTTGDISLSWGPSETAGATYVLEESTTYNFSSGIQTVFTGNATSLLLTERSSGNTYYYRVRATKSDYVESGWREVSQGVRVSIPQKVGIPGEMTLPTTSLDGAYTVFWEISSTAGATYVLEESTSSDFSGGNQVVYSGLGTSTALSGRASETTYYYRIKAIKDGFQDSDYFVAPHGVATSSNLLNGICGSSDGGTFSSVPTTNLCTQGNASSVSGVGPWSWSCSGANGGTTASCQALKFSAATVAPVIELIANASITAEQPYTGPTPSLSQGTAPITWTLVSPPSGMSINQSTGVVSWSNPAASASPYTITIKATNSVGSDQESWQLSATSAPTNGICGSSDGATVTSVPTTNLCTFGNASTVTGTGPWTWTCAGINGGTTASCQALKSTSGGTDPWQGEIVLTGNPVQGEKLEAPLEDVGGLVISGNWLRSGIPIADADFNINLSSMGSITVNYKKEYSLTQDDVGSVIALRISYPDSSGNVFTRTSAATGTVESSGIPSLIVTPSAGANGSISPNTQQSVNSGATKQFTITPDNGYQTVTPIGGTCPQGTLTGTTYTTGTITGNCTVAPTFTPVTYTITPSAGANGSISPNTQQSVASGATKQFTITADSGYQTVTPIGGTCPQGTLNGTTYYTTGAITGNCTIAPTFSVVNAGCGARHWSDLASSSPVIMHIAGNLTINGRSATTCDEVAVFDTAGIMIGSFLVEDSDLYGDMVLNGDYSVTTGSDEGAAYGELLSLKVWDSVDQVEYDSSNVSLRTPTYTIGPYSNFQPPFTFAGNTYLQMDIVVDPGVSVFLNAGWNFIGWNTVAGYFETGTPPTANDYISGSSMDAAMISSVISTMGLTPVDAFIIVGPEGVVYMSGSPFNTLKKVLPGKGYWVYTGSSKEIFIPGASLSPEQQLPLAAGWSQIGYWGDDGLSPEAGFSCIDGLYDILVNESGKVYMPGSPFNTLNTLQQNKGYYIHTTAPTTLTYQCN